MSILIEIGCGLLGLAFMLVLWAALIASHTCPACHDVGYYMMRGLKIPCGACCEIEDVEG